MHNLLSIVFALYHHLCNVFYYILVAPVKNPPVAIKITQPFLQSSHSFSYNASLAIIRSLLRVIGSLLLVTRSHLRTIRSLLRISRSLLRVIRSPLRISGCLLRITRSLLRVIGSLLRVIGSLLPSIRSGDLLLLFVTFQSKSFNIFSSTF